MPRRMLLGVEGRWVEGSGDGSEPESVEVCRFANRVAHDGQKTELSFGRLPSEGIVFDCDEVPVVSRGLVPAACRSYSARANLLHPVQIRNR